MSELENILIDQMNADKEKDLLNIEILEKIKDLNYRLSMIYANHKVSTNLDEVEAYISYNMHLLKQISILTTQYDNLIKDYKH